jgi:predicted permease
MDSFSTVILKVSVMIIMMAVGYILSKRKVITDEGTSEITTILLEIVTPCLLISSFSSVSADSISAYSIILAVVTATCSLFIGIGISRLMFKKEDESRRDVLRYSIIFSNAGFMGLPLIQGILGDAGIIYGSIFIVMFNVVCWTYGYSMMSSGGKLIWKKVFVNPGMIGLYIGLPIFILKIKLPDIILLPITGFADMNTPLAMLVVGSYIAKVRLREIFTDTKVLVVSVFRLITVPLLMLLLLMVIKPEYNLFISTMIQTSAPAAANTVLFAVMFGQDAKLASKTIASTTLFSVITIPLMTVLSQYICSLIL